MRADGSIQCDLCPKGCIIAHGQSGECRIRVNLDGTLRAVTYGHPCSVNVDPVEKKPVFHFLPGTGILSVATVGCNLHCRNCQNWEISQENPENIAAYRVPPEDLPSLARRYGCQSVAYTYTDPVVYYEYALDGCIATHGAGLKNVLVTAGYINREPMERLCRHVDAANIDLKALSEEFYRDVCDATLQPVLDTLVLARSMGVLLEVTNLVIPTLNDGEKEIRSLCRWIVENLGRETPLHFSRFFPHFRMRHLPPTPPETLDRARDIGKAEGLHHVYIGNILRPGGEDTRCPRCDRLLVQRRRYTILKNEIEGGRCPGCGSEVHGIWK